MSKQISQILQKLILTIKTYLTPIFKISFPLQSQQYFFLSNEKFRKTLWEKNKRPSPTIISLMEKWRYKPFSSFYLKPSLYPVKKINLSELPVLTCLFCCEVDVGDRGFLQGLTEGVLSVFWDFSFISLGWVLTLCAKPKSTKAYLQIKTTLKLIHF